MSIRKHNSTYAWADRSRRFWYRHRTLLWTLHSGWALATGVVVVMLAHERYAFIPWVVAFLVVIWSSTLFFGRSAPDAIAGAEVPANVGQEVGSYLTRVLYQETLFFLIPFYAYSTVLDSPNVLFLVLLAGLAVLACLDLIFDRWLRLCVTFALTFLATIAFAATNLLLPLVIELPPRVATPVAAAVAIGSAIPIALRGAKRAWGTRLRLGTAALAMVGIAVGVPSLIPPVPLRLQETAFAADIDPETLELQQEVRDEATSGQLGGRIIVLAKVFAPGVVPARVQLEWRRDGRAVDRSREVSVLAHEGGFRIWDAFRSEGAVPPGRYRVELRSQGDRVFGTASLNVTR